MKVTIRKWHAVATWRWDIPDDDVCGICQVHFDGTCPTCKYPGDDCSLLSGKCGHNFHMHCIVEWIKQDSSKGQCPMCRQKFEWTETAAVPFPSMSEDRFEASGIAYRAEEQETGVRIAGTKAWEHDVQWRDWVVAQNCIGVYDTPSRIYVALGWSSNESMRECIPNLQTRDFRLLKVNTVCAWRKNKINLRTASAQEIYTAVHWGRDRPAKCSEEHKLGSTDFVVKLTPILLQAPSDYCSHILLYQQPMLLPTSHSARKAAPQVPPE